MRWGLVGHPRRRKQTSKYWDEVVGSIGTRLLQKPEWDTPFFADFSALFSPFLFISRSQRPPAANSQRSTLLPKQTANGSLFLGEGGYCSFRFTENQIKDRGLEAIAHALSVNTTVQMLNVCRVSVSPLLFVFL